MSKTGSSYRILRETGNGSNGIDLDDCITLINTDTNEVQSQSVQFKNESRDKTLNFGFKNASDNKSKNGTLKRHMMGLKEDKTKTILGVLVVVSFIVLFCHVIYINCKMRETRKSLEKANLKIADLEENQNPTDLMESLQRMTALEDDFAKSKSQIDQLEEKHKIHVHHISQTHTLHMQHLQNLTDRLDTKEAQLEVINSTLQNQNYSTEEKNPKFSPPTSMNGIYIWKVTNFTKTLFTGRFDTLNKIYSDPFYSSQFGYKMCLFISSGDGLFARSHLSIYFNLMKGEMDDILKWPFNYEVTIMLLDQSLKGNHFERSFWPETHEIFDKPTTPIAPRGWGWQRFISLQSLRSTDNYLKNETIYIKVIVKEENKEEEKKEEEDLIF